MAYSRSATDALDDYFNLRQVPMVLSALFLLASAYQFGGVGTISFPWFNYTLTAEHAVLGSTAAFVVAFASSETKSFDMYETWEQALIAAGPAVILGQQYVTEVNNLLLDLGDPLGYQIAFALTAAS